MAFIFTIDIGYCRQQCTFWELCRHDQRNKYGGTFKVTLCNANRTVIEAVLFTKFKSETKILRLHATGNKSFFIFPFSFY